MKIDSFLSVLHRFGRTVRHHPMIAHDRSWFPWGALLLFVTACGIDESGLAPALPPDQVLARVRFEASVYNLATTAPYNTVQLRATGYSGTGQVIDAPIEFSVAPASATKLSLDSTGMLSAVAEGKKLMILARMKYNGMTQTDSALVYVFPGTSSQPDAHLLFRIAPGDSAKIASRLTMTKSLELLRLDSREEPIPSFVVKVWSLDSTIARVVSGYDIFGDDEIDNFVQVDGSRPGRTTLYASAYVYGRMVTDSITLRIGWPLIAAMRSRSTLLPKTFAKVLEFPVKRVIIATGGCVAWLNDDRDLDIDVTFDDPSSVGPAANRLSPACRSPVEREMDGGNIEPFHLLRDGGRIVPLSQYRSRTFPKPGVYTYRSTLWGTTGEVVVCDEGKDDPICAPENYLWLYPAQ